MLYARYTKKPAYRDKHGVWHPTIYNVNNLFQLIGIGSITSVVVKQLAYSHLANYLSPDSLNQIFFMVNDHSNVHDSAFFRILHKVAKLLLASTKTDSKRVASFVNKNNIFPRLKKKGTKQNILISGKIETAKLYLAALIRWYYSKTPDSRAAWLANFERLLLLKEEAKQNRSTGIIDDLIDSCYTVSTALHRDSYERAHTLTQSQIDRLIDNIFPDDEIPADLVAYNFERKKEHLKECLATLPFVQFFF